MPVVREDFAVIASKWDSLTDDQREKAAEMKRRFDEGEAKAAQSYADRNQRVESLLLDSEKQYAKSLDPLSKAARESGSRMRTPEKETLFKNKSFASMFGVKPQNYPVLRDVLAKKLWGVDSITEDEFLRRGSEHAQKNRDTRELSKSAGNAAVAAALVESDPDKAFAEWAEQNLPDGKVPGVYMRVWDDVFAEVDRDAQGIRDVAKKWAHRLSYESGIIKRESVDGGASKEMETNVLLSGEDFWLDMANEMYDATGGDERLLPMVGQVVAEIGKLTNERKYSSPLGEMERSGTRFMRGLDRGQMFLANQLQKLAGVATEAALGSEEVGAKKASKAATEASIDRRELAMELQRGFEAGYNQIKGALPADKWYGGIERGLYSMPELLGYSLSAPSWGGAALGASAIAADVSSEIRKEYGVERNVADGIGAITGGATILSERFSTLFSLGKYPALQAAIEKVLPNRALGHGFKNFTKRAGLVGLKGGVRFGAAGGVEFGTEIGQEYIDDVTQNIFSAFRDDVPEADLDNVIDVIEEQGWELVGALLPFAAIGAGSAGIKDFSMGLNIVKDVDVMRASGFTDTMIADVLKQPTAATMEATVRKHWENRERKSPEESVRRARPQAEPEPGDPVITPDPGGHRVAYPSGESVVFPTVEEAAWVQNRAREKRRRVLDDTTRAYADQNAQVLNIRREIDDETRTTETDVASGVVPESAIIEDINLSTELMGLPAEDAGAPRIVLGSNSVEVLKNQVARGVVRLQEGANIITVMREDSGASLRAALENKEVSRETVERWFKEWDKATGDNLYQGNTDKQLVESWMAMASSYGVVGSKSKEPVKGFRGAIAAAIKAYKALSKQIVGRAAKIRRAIRKGEFDSDFGKALHSSLGFSVTPETAAARKKAVGEVYGKDIGEDIYTLAPSDYIRKLEKQIDEIANKEGSISGRTTERAEKLAARAKAGFSELSNTLQRIAKRKKDIASEIRGKYPKGEWSRRVKEAWDKEQIERLETERKSVDEWIATIDAIALGLPDDVRKLVTPLKASVGSRTIREKIYAIQRKLNQIDKAMERHLKKRYIADINKVIKNTRAKIKGGVVKGFGVNQTFLNEVEAAKGMTTEDIQAATDELLRSDSGIENARDKFDIIDQFGGLNDKNSSQIAAALGWLRDKVGDQRAERAAYLMDREARRTAARSSILGKIGTSGRELANKANAEVVATVARYSPLWAFDQRQILRHVLGDVGDELGKRIQKGVETKRIEYFQAKEATYNWIIDNIDGVKSRYGAMNWMAERGLKREKAYELYKEERGGKLSGPPEVVERTKMEALNEWLFLKQPGYSHNMVERGYPPGTIKKIEDFMGEDLVAFGRYMVSRLDETWHEFNPVYQRMFGTDMPKTPLYFPGAIDTPWENQTIDAVLDPYRGAINLAARSTPSGVMGRVAHDKPAKIQNAHAAFFSHLNEMIYWKNMAETTADLREVYHGEGGEVKKAVEGKYGSGVSRKISTIIDMANADGRANGIAFNYANAGAIRMYEGAAAAGLGYKLTTNLLQVSNVIAAGMRVSWGDLAGALPKSISVSDFQDIWNTNYMQVRLKEGAFPEIRDLMAMSPEKRVTALQRFVHEGHALLSFTDSFWLTISGVTALNAQRNRFRRENPNLSKAEVDRLAKAETEDILRQVGQPTDWTARSLPEANSNLWTKMFFFMFLSDARRKVSYQVEAVMNGDVKDVAKMTLMMHVLYPGLEFMARGLGEMVVGDEDWDEFMTGERFLQYAIPGQIGGIPIWGRIGEILVRWQLGLYSPGRDPINSVNRFFEDLSKWGDGWDSVTDGDFEDAAKEFGRALKALGRTGIFPPAGSMGNLLEQAGHVPENFRDFNRWLQED